MRGNPRLLANRQSLARVPLRPSPPQPRSTARMSTAVAPPPLSGRSDKSASSRSRSKDDAALRPSKVSHVVCKFYRAGNCTAGASCPFSHDAPVGGRPVCQYFAARNNCRFGHKCALAHLRPGEPMSMDRKNKRAAQAAAREASATPLKSPTAEESASFSEQSSPVRGDMDEPAGHVRSSTIRGSRLEDFDDDLDFGPPDDFLGATTQNSTGTLKASTFARGRAAHTPSTVALNTYQATPAMDPFEGGFRESVRRFGVTPTSPQATLSPTSDPWRGPKTPATERGVPLGHGRSTIRDSSPGPFGTSPFSLPGSRSVFLPQPGSAGSDHGMAQSAPNAFSPPRRISLAVGSPLSEEALSHDDQEDDDVSEFLPSSLHSLLSREERRRHLLRRPAGEPRAAFDDDGDDFVSWHPQTDMESLGANYPDHSAFASSYAPPSRVHHRDVLPHPLMSEYARSPPLVSPGSRMIPGSLPQGLAAGLSRLHLRSPTKVSTSPPGTTSGSSMGGGGGGTRTASSHVNNQDVVFDLRLGGGGNLDSRATTTWNGNGVPPLPSTGQVGTMTTSALSQRLAQMNSIDTMNPQHYSTFQCPIIPHEMISSPLNRNLTTCSTGDEVSAPFVLEM